MNTDKTIHVDKIDGDVPPDATHAYKIEKEKWLFYKENGSGDILARWQFNDTWSIQSTDKLPDLKIIRTPKEAPVKDEPYVPKVGDECEVYTWVMRESGQDKEWTTTMVYGTKDGKVIGDCWEWSGKVALYDQFRPIRPIRTEEDKKRDWLKENQPGLPADEKNKDAINAYLDIYTENLIKAGVTLPESES